MRKTTIIVVALCLMPLGGLFAQTQAASQNCDDSTSNTKPMLAGLPVRHSDYADFNALAPLPDAASEANFRARHDNDWSLTQQRRQARLERLPAERRQAVAAGVAQRDAKLAQQQAEREKRKADRQTEQEKQQAERESRETRMQALAPAYFVEREQRITENRQRRKQGIGRVKMTVEITGQE